MEKKNYIHPMTETHEVRYRSILALSFQIKDQDADPETEMLSKGFCDWQGEDLNEY